MNLFKTAIGKVILFLLTLFFSLSAIAGVFGVVLCYEYNMYEEGYQEGTYATYEEHDDTWIHSVATELIMEAEDGTLPIRAQVEGDYGYAVYKNNQQISYGTSLYYNYINNDDWNFTIKNSVVSGDYEVIIWTSKYETNYAEYERIVIGVVEQYRAYWHYVAVVGSVMTLICFIGLMCVSGRKNKCDEPVGGPLNVLPFDLELAGATAIVIFVACACNEIMNEMSSFTSDIVIFTLVASVVICLCFFYIICMEIAARIKLKNLFSHTVIGMILRFIWRIVKKIGGAIGTFFKNLSFIWAGVLLTAFFVICEFIGLLVIWDQGDLLIIWFFEKLVLVPLLIYLMICMHRLHVGTRAIAAGEMSYRTDTSHMFGRFKEHGENLNKISEGMSRAVNEKLKSERMKTELITNVSHDIKTPLTSIINYSDLISKEECDNTKIAEYAEVISRQSGRLKRLLEDLLELSKATTGNVTVNLEQCDAGILLEQATGEYAEKLEKAGLLPIVTIPEESIYINADRRLLWRIFDNLLSNMSKYALEGTRVYFTLSKEGNQAVFRFKNTSREMLNITAEELKARFVRGDASRNTEGNGLGLSIAENLVSNQGGKLDLFIDADLFVATISFECVEKVAGDEPATEE